MANVSTFFSALLGELELRDYQDNLVEQRRNNLVACLSNLGTVLDVFRTGSHKKRTIVRPLSGDKFDVDCFAVLSEATHVRFRSLSQGPSQLLQYIRNHLNSYSQYSNTTIRANGQAVTIHLYNFDIDVVPAFRMTYSAYSPNFGYIIPDSRNGGTWIATYPEEQERELDRLNTGYGYTLKKLIHLIKGWTKAKNVPLSGFMIETLAMNYIMRYPMKAYSMSSLLQDFFFQLSSGAVTDDYKGEHVLSPLSSSSYADYRSKLQTARDVSLRAQNFEDTGYSDSAIQTWQQLFGAYIR